MKFYTGVGSRQTPGAVLDLMREVGRVLAIQGWTLRSGAAEGADQAFEAGCDDVNGNKQIFIAWDGFCGRKQGENGVVQLRHCEQAKASAMAASIHPAWDRLKRGAQGLHSRNCFQVLGEKLDSPSKFVVCYAALDKRGEPKGGTRTAIKLAEQSGVKVFNLYKEDDFNRIESWMEEQWGL